uniref:13E12 repeat family protein n=1 Tax=Nocardioides ferulae TaxID=2340821 RepID=UPI001F0C7C64
MPTSQHPQPHEITDLDARATLAAATQTMTTRRAAEVTEMRLAAHWATLHGEPVREAAGELAGLVDPMTQPGGDGTPELREHCIAELGMARHTHAATARALIADTLDLQHRLPKTWAVVEALAAEPWIARRVAVMTRNLPADKVGLVDRAVAKAIGRVAPGKVFDLVAAKIIEADPEAHASRRERARHERYVKLSKTDEHGFRHIIAKVTAGDAVWFDALVDRVADILALE